MHCAALRLLDEKKFKAGLSFSNTCLLITAALYFFHQNIFILWGTSAVKKPPRLPAGCRTSPSDSDTLHHKWK